MVREARIAIVIMMACQIVPTVIVTVMAFKIARTDARMTQGATN
jgi:hypothetical protein